MTMLDSLLGGANRQQLDDFVQRYDQGPPWEGFSDEEAVTNYQRVATQLPAQDYRHAAQEAFARLTPEQRAQLGQFLQTQTQQYGVRLPTQSGPYGGAWQDPDQLAQATTQLHEQQPDLLGQLLGGAVGQGGQGGQGQLGNILSSPIAKAALAGIAAIAIKQLQARQGR